MSQFRYKGRSCLRMIHWVGTVAEHAIVGQIMYADNICNIMGFFMYYYKKVTMPFTAVYVEVRFDRD